MRTIPDKYGNAGTRGSPIGDRDCHSEDRRVAANATHELTVAHNDRAAGRDERDQDRHRARSTTDSRCDHTQDLTFFRHRYQTKYCLHARSVSPTTGDEFDHTQSLARECHCDKNCSNASEPMPSELSHHPDASGKSYYRVAHCCDITADQNLRVSDCH